jgi:UDP-glucose 4-epimerase
MKSALVTGSSGFIGRHLIRALKKKKVKVVEFSSKKGRQLTNHRHFAKLPSVDVVFHLGAVSGYQDSNENTFQAYEVNVAGTVNVLEYCRRAKAKLIFPSTYVYDRPYTAYKKESHPALPCTHYAYTKYLGEQCCQFYSRIYGVDTLILRTSNVYGKGQDDKYIVPVIATHLLANKPLALTKPKVERSYVHVDDVVKAYLKLASSKTKPGDVFNVAYPEPTTLIDLIKLMEKVAGTKGKITFSGVSRPHDVDKNRFDISKIKNAINWQPEVSLESGLNNYFTSLK